MQYETWKQVIHLYNTIIKQCKMTEMFLIHIKRIGTQQIKCLQI
jgi:hypothetical protein